MLRLDIISTTTRVDPTNIGRSAQIARSATYIVHAFAEITALGSFSPAWPQVHQICVSAQLTLLCLAGGQLHRLEAANMISTVTSVLSLAEAMWPSLTLFKQSLSNAMALLGELSLYSMS